MAATLREATADPLARPADGRPDPNGRASRAAVETARVLETELAARIGGEVRFDRVSRMLYATDASNYQIEPVGVVVPKSTEDVVATVELAASHGVPILPRGGGSSLAGQAVGAALVVDCSKYLTRVLEVDAGARTATVEPGINLDLLNKRLKPSGLMFGPDPSSANRATVGGVVGNNSAGAHSILYGMTADSLRGIRVALADGGVVDLGPATPGELAARAAADDPTGRLLGGLLAFRERHRDLIRRDFPPHWRRATGYSLDQFLAPDETFNPARLLASSEGTLATTLRVTLDLVPAPTRTGLLVLQFDELVAAMAATPAILEAEPSAIELMDRMLIGLTRAQPGFAAQIAFIEGDPAAVLCVEFYGETERDLDRRCDRLEALLAKRGVRLSADPLRVLDAKRQADIWSVRKAGLGLLMSVKGDAKPIPVIEDVSVPVPHLADYVRAVEEMVAAHGTTAAYYAHASAGCLHIRPLVSLKTIGGISAMTEMAHAAAELAHRFGGVMSGEHGDGLQRSELNEVIFGPDLYAAMREFKAIWDPRGLMNPGKIVDAPPMTEYLRFGTDYKPLELKTHLDFGREGGFLAAVEMCNGAGVCRKLKAGTMCPSYMATKDENDTTRGRANALRNALAGRILDRTDFASKETYGVLDLCISCKACKTECPSSVDMAKIKTEFLAHYHERHGTPLRARVFGHIHTISKLSAPLAPVANLALKTPLASPIMRALGVHPERRLSPFVRRTFVHRWRQHQESRPANRSTRGKAVYFHDTFATYNYPRIGLAAVQLLEAAGFEVVVEERRACCGRPMLSKGLVDAARKVAKRNVSLLAPYAKQGIPIVGTEPSCILTLRDEYRDLLPNDPDVAAVAAETFMLDEFLAKLAAADDLGIAWKPDPGPDVFFHGHCHQKALIGVGPSMAILSAAGCRPTESGAGCCGMAGSFGYEAEHYDVSRKIGEERLFPAVAATNTDTVVAVAGVSCRQQIEHFTDRPTRHIAEVLADRVAPGDAFAARALEPVPAAVTPTPEETAHAKQTPPGPA
ncbi:MAG: Fe-S protein, homolog of lactate dehydrogenase SO1521 [uncultured Thermomicrobiales bacterium]|uniref:Fe-S protein, homolog of lactate dehydrogenase SO1521 n=1 Tax=uncultured Thermomicrobiales bacterium TaxID=1645740 RepID=A0A6J4TWV2_9BACT|nr:MAG: Fe-S protein, homolog of lactate dehydrogenase SO1521 [uncultured Thermomicrobiales bacterium]